MPDQYKLLRAIPNDLLHEGLPFPIGIDTCVEPLLFQLRCELVETAGPFAIAKPHPQVNTGIARARGRGIQACGTMTTDNRQQPSEEQNAPADVPTKKHRAEISWLSLIVHQSFASRPAIGGRISA